MKELIRGIIRSLNEDNDRMKNRKQITNELWQDGKVKNNTPLWRNLIKMISFDIYRAVTDPNVDLNEAMK